jgi:hypothetical protein
VGNLGLITIPCIVFYIMQLFIDSFIANTWASKYERFASMEAAINEQLQQLEGKAPSTGPEQQLSSKVASKLSSGAGGAAAAAGAAAAHSQGSEADRLIGTSVVVAGSAARPSRAALLNRRSSASSDGEEAGLMQNVELNDVNPLAHPASAAAAVGAQQQPGARAARR